jgi:hypothetical protein
MKTICFMVSARPRTLSFSRNNRKRIRRQASVIRRPAKKAMQLSDCSPPAMARAIETGQIEKPSAVVTRAEDARHLGGDLANIVLMTMRKESARRYRSVEELSEDIRRHLTGRQLCEITPGNKPARHRCRRLPAYHGVEPCTGRERLL